MSAKCIQWQSYLPSSWVIGKSHDIDASRTANGLQAIAHAREDFLARIRERSDDVAQHNLRESLLCQSSSNENIYYPPVLNCLRGYASVEDESATTDSDTSTAQTLMAEEFES